VFGHDIQPPVWDKPYINQSLVYDFWIEKFQFASDPWRPLIHTEEEIRKRITDDFNTALQRYIADGKRYLDTRPELRRTRVKAEKLHYEWLARFQCGEERIADLTRTRAGAMAVNSQTGADQKPASGACAD
jgi:hypothetical protein